MAANKTSIFFSICLWLSGIISYYYIYLGTQSLDNHIDCVFMKEQCLNAVNNEIHYEPTFLQIIGIIGSFMPPLMLIFSIFELDQRDKIVKELEEKLNKEPPTIIME